MGLIPWSKMILGCQIWVLRLKLRSFARAVEMFLKSKVMEGAGAMTSWFRALAAFLEAGLIPGTHMLSLNDL